MALSEKHRSSVAGLRTELCTEIGGVRTEIAGLEARLTERMRQQTMWFMGTLVSSMVLVLAIVAALR